MNTQFGSGTVVRMVAFNAIVTYLVMADGRTF